jgi:hypothetical protein
MVAEKAGSRAGWLVD